MLRRYFFLIFILLLQFGCARHTHNLPKPPPAVKSTVLTRAMPAFNQVVVTGAVNVSLHTGYKHSEVILHGNSQDIQQTITQVGNKQLLVRPNGGRGQGSISVEIRTNHLNSFSYKGNGTIAGRHIHSSLLDLKINNPGQATFGGSIGLRKLEVSGGGMIQISDIYSRDLKLDIKDKTKVLLVGQMSPSHLELIGEGWLSMYWVKSTNLTICAKGKMNIRLAGIVDKLDIELWGASHFDGRYLRAQNAFVKTYGKSIAELTAIKHQHTLATDASDIYFYNIPQTKADFMAYQGSVLDMRDWNSPDLKDYDRFNKETH